ncbi:MAG: helix-turn-helix domain-containing protein [Desulfovibrio sp.]|jgi:hypothetical protein|nr:helix-turn-helix domain-containing protein [Desulfovibrio sp.]
MNILVPSQLFLRVREKNYAHFAHKDQSLGRDALAVYLRLFSLAVDSGSVSLPQRELADDVRVSVRTLQNALRSLANTGYVHVVSSPGLPSTYNLLLSDHVLKQIRRFDLIDNPSWYSRSGGSTAMQAVETAAPPQEVRSPRARPAHPLYNVYKNNKKGIPPTPPLPQPCQSPPTGSAGEGGFSSDFLKLWDAHPIKKGKNSAYRAYTELALGKDAPPLDRLLEVIAAFKAGDDQWKRGYAPYLATWLRERRWDDEILSRGSVTSGTTAPVPRAAIMTLPPRPSISVELSPEAEKRLREVCAALSELWPGPVNDKPIAAFLRPRASAGALSALPLAAKAYLAAAPKPMSLWRWLQTTEEHQHHGNENEIVSRAGEGRICGQQRGNRQAA